MLITGAALLIAAAAIIISTLTTSPYKTKANALKKAAAKFVQTSQITQNVDTYTIFISTGNGEYRANVYMGRDTNFNKAFNIASKKAEAASKQSKHPVKYVKCDVVYNELLITAEDLTESLQESRDKYFFYGITFDPDYETALLEAECNSTDIYNYETGELDVDTVNNYLSQSRQISITGEPEQVMLFETYSWFCDENNKVYEISEDWDTYGRRKIDTLDKPAVESIVTNAVKYMVDNVDMSTGKFNYSHYPSGDIDSPDYNIVRHVGVIWSLVAYYDMTHDETIQPIIRNAIEYTLSCVKYKNDNTSYLIGEDAENAWLGGNGLAVTALSSYMKVFDDDTYLASTEHLANGILALVKPNGEGYYHQTDANLEPVDEFVTVYYDGEATLGLCAIYDITQNPVYLDAAKAAGDYFEQNHYETFGDHWISYAMNELTKHCPDQEQYYKLSMRNLAVALSTLADRPYPAPTALELFMAGFETYLRYKENFDVDISIYFNPQDLVSGVRTRTDMQLNGVFWPEYAMYMPYPNKIMGAFYTRSDNFRIRMDDIQHNVYGYYNYWKNYDILLANGMPLTP